MVYYIISLLGQFIGALLAYKISEEMSDGEKYFKILKICLLPVIIIYSFISISNWVWVLTIMTISILIKKEYFFFGGIVLNNPLLASFVFIYGLPYGSLSYFKNKDLNEIKYNILYFISGMLSTVLLDLIPYNIIRYF